MEATEENVEEEEAVEEPNLASNTWRESLYDGKPETDSMSQRAFKFLFPVFLWIGSFGFAHMIWMSEQANQWITYSFMYGSFRSIFYSSHRKFNWSCYFSFCT